MAQPNIKTLAAKSRARQRWALVRMHFLHFSQASRSLTERHWDELIRSVLAQHRRQQQQQLLEQSQSHQHLPQQQLQ